MAEFCISGSKRVSFSTDISVDETRKAMKEQQPMKNEQNNHFYAGRLCPSSKVWPILCCYLELVQDD
ncbi:hypothetical protein T11_8043 [Trichinella zimbabwensis]|uniref:Uncharacterized protein n=1 Tax=Trichinella zimbabwensis TaxID=268475 RepID=A0A0V1H199_9BILA|nr:hypothetical protein T11_8043 [Trichinella zimbabwensis]